MAVRAGSLPPLRPAWPFLAGSGSSGARPTTRAFRPGASLNRRVIQSAVVGVAQYQASLFAR